MFPMDITGNNNQQQLYRNNAPQQQQMFSNQYGYQQQQQPYYAYANQAATPGKDMSFMTPQPYMASPQQHMFYGYPQQQAANASQYMPTQQPPPARYPQQNSNNNSMNHYSGNRHGDGGTGPARYGGGRGRGGYYGQGHRQVHNNYYYNQQHHYSNNNAVPEKTPTLHLLHPVTKKIVSVKLNRIYNTTADVRPQLQHHRAHEKAASNAEGEVEGTNTEPIPKFNPKDTKLVLCQDFLGPRGCAIGNSCSKVHIAGLEYTWSIIEPTETKGKDGERMYAEGFVVHCYDAGLARYYKVPSEAVAVTKGSEDYIAMFNNHGDNFKTKFKVCADMNGKMTCSKGADCEDIHCSVKDLEAEQEGSANVTHVNDAAAMTDIPRLPETMVVRVFNQNSFDVSRDYAGSSVLMTEGAKAYAKHYEQEMNNVPQRKRMQHCAHFRLKDMCRLGSSCRFLHVLPTEEEIKERAEAEKQREAEEAAKAAAEQAEDSKEDKKKETSS